MFRKVIIPGSIDKTNGVFTFSIGDFVAVYLEIDKDYQNITYGYGNLYGINYGNGVII